MVPGDAGNSSLCHLYDASDSGSEVGVLAGRKTSPFGLYAVIHSYQPVCFSCFGTLICVRRRPEQIETRSTDGRGCFLLVVLTWKSFFF